MKKILGIIVCTVLFFASTNAQVKMADNVNTRDHASHQANKTHKKALMKELNLSKQQKSQMKQMHKSMKPQKKAIMENASLSAEQKKEQLKQLRMGQRNKMSSILTPEQLAKWKTDKEMGRRKGK